MHFTVQLMRGNSDMGEALSFLLHLCFNCGSAECFPGLNSVKNTPSRKQMMPKKQTKNGNLSKPKRAHNVLNNLHGKMRI
jgi:hypothetical protein